MNYRKGSLLLLFAAAMVSMTAMGQKKWTFAECVDYALQNNITLQKSQIKQQTAAEEVKGSKAQFLPSLSASTNQSLGYRPWQDSGVATVTNGQVNAKVDKSYYNGSYGLNAQWTVWNGNKNVNNYRLSKLSEKQAVLDSESTANNILEKMAQLYVQILYLSEAVKVSQSLLETSQKNEERGKEMVNVGKMSKADLAQLSAQRATDEYNLVEAQSQVVNCKLQLKQLLEIIDTEEFDIEIPVTTDEQALAEIPVLRSVYEAALTSRPEIASSQMAVKSSELSVAIAKAGSLPTVGLTAGLGTSTNSLSNNGWGKQMKSNFDASAGVSVSIPILDQRQAKTNVAKAKLANRQAQLDLQDARKELYQTIEGYWLDAQTNQQKFRSALMTLESEQQSYDLLQEQFNLGLKNIVELMTGKDHVMSAQQSRLQSKYMTILNIQLLKFYEGKKFFGN